jgi:hypothetical protein
MARDTRQGEPLAGVPPPNVGFLKNTPDTTNSASTASNPIWTAVWNTGSQAYAWKATAPVVLSAQGVISIAPGSFVTAVTATLPVLSSGGTTPVISVGSTGWKNVEGTVWVDPTNTMGWAGSDAGAWINSALAYLEMTYGASYGGEVRLAPGQYNYTTSISFGVVGFSFAIRGPCDGNGAAVLNYTPTTGVAMTVAGGSGNNGGVILEDFTLTGASSADATTGIQWGMTGVGVAGATMKNVAILRFGTGEAQFNGSIVYAVEHINCKIQSCNVGTVPQGENIVWIGGLIGSCATGMNCSNPCEVQISGAAFDDNTTSAITVSNASARVVCSARFENPSLGTNTYVTISAGQFVGLGNRYQDDATTGTSTGFVQASGGSYIDYGTWLYSGGRTQTQVYNVSGSVLCHADPVIAPGSAAGAISFSSLFTAGYAGAPKPLDWTRLSNTNTAAQSITLTAASPGTYITSSNLNIPNPIAGGGAGLAVGASFRWRVTLTKTAAGTNTTSLIIFGGTNGSTADTVLATLLATGAGTAAVDTMQFDVVLTVATAGASGTLFWSITPTHVAAAATGFGTPVSAGLSGTTAAFNLTTAGLKFGLGIFGSATGATYTVTQVEAQAFNVN